MRQVEKHLIKKSHPCYHLLKEFCVKSRKLYNHANYLVRQRFIAEDYWIRYGELDKTLKADVQYPDYKNMPTAQSAQQILRLLDKNWKSFFKAIKDWKQHPSKYTGRPKLPRYKHNTQVLMLTNQECKLKNNKIYFPKCFDGFTISPKFIEYDYSKFNQVRFIPKGNHIIAEIIYEIADVESLPNNQKYMSMDLGVNNLATCVSNVKSPEIVNGRPLKAINQFYNKRRAYLQSRLPKNRKSSNKIQRITAKRNRQIEDYLHKSSKHIVKTCIENQINTIIIGKNDGWKQNVNMSKKVNQNFVSIPFNRLIEMIEYKAAKVGVTVIQTEESYTSGTSFLDNELPTKEFYNKRRRVHRGLFKSNTGMIINADVNGAYQIMKKVVPNVINEWDRGCGLQPVLWTV